MEPQAPATAVKTHADESQRRPGCLVIYTALLGVASGLAFMAALALTLLVLSYGRGFMGEEVAIIVSFLIFGLPGLPIAWGLWRRKNWARVALIVFASLSAVWYLVGLVLALDLPEERLGDSSFSIAMGVIPILVNGVIIYWFARGRRYFH